MSHYNAMIGQPVTLSGYSEGPNVADTVIEASSCLGGNVYAYPYSDTSRTPAPNTRIYEPIKGCFPHRWRPQNRDSTRAILGNALKCRCRDREGLAKEKEASRVIA